VYDSDPGRGRSLRAVQDDRIAVDEDPSLIWLMDTSKDLYNGALACAVFAEERVYFTT
jgi:hypothetical protein